MMWKYTVQVEGMMCGMCENHVNDAVRKALPVKKVASSRKKGETTVFAAQPLDEDALRAAIAATGYEVGSMLRGGQKRAAGLAVSGLTSRPRRAIMRAVS